MSLACSFCPRIPLRQGSFSTLLGASLFQPLEQVTVEHFYVDISYQSKAGASNLFNQINLLLTSAV